MVLPVIVTEHILILLISGSENDQLHIITAQLIHHTLDQIKTLLIGQTGNDTDRKLLLINRKSKLFLKSALILYLLLAEILCIVALCDQGIGLRIELIVIDAV